MEIEDNQQKMKTESRNTMVVKSNKENLSPAIPVKAETRNTMKVKSSQENKNNGTIFSRLKMTFGFRRSKQ